MHCAVALSPWAHRLADAALAPCAVSLEVSPEASPIKLVGVSIATMDSDAQATVTTTTVTTTNQAP